MTQNEMILTILAEEASEVAQAASKVLRFGPHHTWPTVDAGSTTAADRLIKELADLAALVEMAQAAGLLTKITDATFHKYISEKKDRVAKYMAISQSLGRLV